MDDQELESFDTSAFEAYLREAYREMHRAMMQKLDEQILGSWQCAPSIPNAFITPWNIKKANRLIRCQAAVDAARRRIHG